MERKLIIAVDGYSATGKSSVSKEVAQELGIIHIDSGAMYRAVTWFGLEHHCYEQNTWDIKKLIGYLPTLQIQFKQEENHQKIYIQNQDITQHIREKKVSERVSEVAKIPEVRDYLVQLQRSYGEHQSVIMDGRDIGTVVFPHADYKFFLTASLEVRVQRRYLEEIDRKKNISIEEVQQNLLARDYIDSHREHSPLVKAADAIEIDNSHLTKEQTIEKIVSIIRSN